MKVLKFHVVSSLLETGKPFRSIEIPYCKLNEIKSKYSLRIAIAWKTKNIRSLVPLKYKNDYKSCVIYKGDCSCDSRYIGETQR